MIPWLRRIGWVVLLAAVVYYGYRMVCIPLLPYFKPGLRVILHGNDFKHLYVGARFLKQGRNPYDQDEFLDEASRLSLGGVNPYVYPPTTAIVLRPLIRLGPDQAKLLWFFLNQAMVIGSLVLCIHFFLGWREPWRLAVVALLAATSVPLFRTFTAGQLNCALLLIFCAVYAAERKRLDALAGLAVAFGILFKLVPGVFVLYYLVKRRWRALAWTAGWGAVLLAVSIALAGWRVHAAYVPIMRQMGYGRSVWQDILIDNGVDPFYRDPYNQSLNSLFHHLLAADPVPRKNPDDQFVPLVHFEGDKGARWANRLTVVCALLLLATAVGGIVLAKRRACREETSAAGPPREALEISVMVFLSLLIPSILWDHYPVVLFFPQIVLLARILDGQRWKTRRAAVLTAGCAAALLLGSAIVAWPIAFHLMSRQGLGLFAMSLKLYGVLILFALAVIAILRPQTC